MHGEPLSRFYYPCAADEELLKVDESTGMVEFEYGTLKHYEQSCLLLGRLVLQMSRLELIPQCMAAWSREVKANAPVLVVFPGNGSYFGAFLPILPPHPTPGDECGRKSSRTLETAPRQLWLRHARRWNRGADIRHL